MALEGLTKEQIEEYEQKLLKSVPEVAPIGNVSLREKLGRKWTLGLYWEIRNRLIERGLLAAGKGRGGSVRRVQKEPVTEMADVTSGKTAAEAPAIGVERDLYGPMLEVIRGDWAKDARIDDLVAEITAAQGARQTGGRWTRPDITVASIKTFPYVPGRHFEVITFEVKPIDAVDVTVVYEALGHRRAATKAYALLHVPKDKETESESILDLISQEAKRFGIGVVVARDPGKYDTWEELVEAVRHDPDPERLNDFLAQQVSQGFREQIAKWFK